MNEKFPMETKYLYRGGNDQFRHEYMVNRTCDFVDEIEKRLRHLNSAYIRTSAFSNVDNWLGTSVVKDVLNLEDKPKYSSREERMVHRMDLWVEACHIKKDNIESWDIGNYTDNYSDKTKSLKVKPSHTFNKVIRLAKSINDLQSPEASKERKRERGRIIKDGVPRKTQLITQSTNDLWRNQNNDVIANSDLTNIGSCGPSGDVDVGWQNTMPKFGGKPRILGCIFPSGNKTINQNKERKIGKKLKREGKKKHNSESIQHFEVLHFDAI